MAAVQDGGPGKRQDDGAEDAEGEQRGSRVSGRDGRVVRVLVGGVGVVADGKECSLWDGLR